MFEELSGAVYEGDFISEKYYKGASFHYYVHIPDESEDKKDCGLIVTHDGLNIADAAASEYLYKTGEGPYCITVGIVSGDMEPTVPEAYKRNLRMRTYDLATRVYPDFVVDEFIPFIIDEYNLSISPSPDMHLISGGSSGGVSSWNIAWERNDYFRRVYASSPSFLAMGKGNDFITMIRKYEPKPIRVFTDYSENEPDEYFGSSFCVADAFVRALAFAGYEFAYEFHPNEGHCSRNSNTEDAISRLRYLWKDWKTKPITVAGYSTRTDKLIFKDEFWEETAGKDIQCLCGRHDTVKTHNGLYVARKDSVVLIKNNGDEITVAEGFDNITALLISTDKWIIYLSDSRRGCIYGLTINTDGSLGKPYVHAALHIKTDFHIPGAIDMCLCDDDRILASTEIGIQCIRSFGLIDVVLFSPENTAAEKIGLSDNGVLYALVSGKNYKRRLKNQSPANDNRISEPKNVSYYD